MAHFIVTRILSDVFYLKSHLHKHLVSTPSHKKNPSLKLLLTCPLCIAKGQQFKVLCKVSYHSPVINLKRQICQCSKKLAFR